MHHRNLGGVLRQARGVFGFRLCCRRAPLAGLLTVRDAGGLRGGQRRRAKLDRAAPACWPWGCPFGDTPVSWALPRACSDGTGLQALGARGRRRRASPQSMRVRRLCRELALVSCRSRGPILTSFFALCRERCSPPSGCGVRSTSTTSSCRSPSTAPGPRGTRTSTTARGKRQ